MTKRRTQRIMVGLSCLALSGLGVLFGCSKTVGDFPESQTYGGAFGRRIFIDRCGACHEHPLDFGRFDEEGWTAILSDADHFELLDRHQRLAVLEYVMENR